MGKMISGLFAALKGSNMESSGKKSSSSGSDSEKDEDSKE